LIGFSIDETDYIDALIKRNFSKGFDGNFDDPLERPMSVKERKLRSKIRKKIYLFIDDLVNASLAGFTPTPKMKESGLVSLIDAFNKLTILKSIERAATVHTIENQVDTVQMA